MGGAIAKSAVTSGAPGVVLATAVIVQAAWVALAGTTSGDVQVVVKPGLAAGKVRLMGVSVVEGALRVTVQVETWPATASSSVGVQVRVAVGGTTTSTGDTLMRKAGMVGSSSQVAPASAESMEPSPARLKPSL